MYYIDPYFNCPMAKLSFQMYKVLNMKNVTNTYFCTTLNFCEPETLPRPIELLPVELPNNQTEQPDTTYKIVHITDIHMDDEYEEGAATQCGYLTCCRYKWTGQVRSIIITIIIIIVVVFIINIIVIVVVMVVITIVVVVDVVVVAVVFVFVVVAVVVVVVVVVVLVLSYCWAGGKACIMWDLGH